MLGVLGVEREGVICVERRVRRMCLRHRIQAQWRWEGGGGLVWERGDAVLERVLARRGERERCVPGKEDCRVVTEGVVCCDG